MLLNMVLPDRAGEQYLNECTPFGYVSLCVKPVCMFITSTPGLLASYSHIHIQIILTIINLF